MKLLFTSTLGLVLIFGALVDTPRAQQAPSIKTMTYNIRYDNPDDGVNRWDNRKERVANLIRFHAPEVVGLQEALHHQLTWLEEHLPGYAWIGVGRTDGKEEGEFSPIFYDENRVSLLQHDTFWLSDTPDEPSTGWDAALPRIVTWGKFRQKETGREFYAFNTHFDHRGEQARLESARLIVRKIRELAGDDLPVVLTGDFNSEPNSNPYNAIVESLSDGYHSSKLPHYGPNGTYMDEDGGFSVSSGEGGRRIDYIFTNSRTSVLKHGILSTFRDGRFPSDHLPVIAEIEIW